MTENINNFQLLDKAIIISCLIGIIIFISLFVLLSGEAEGYSQLYLNPDSYSNFPKDEILFIYGIKSFEKINTSYNITIYVDETIIDRDQIQLQPGEKFEIQKRYEIVPNKVTISALTSRNHVYTVHYWVKNASY